MGAQGSATLDFGSGDPQTEDTVAVTGQAGIVSGSHVEAFWMRDSTADSTADEHEGMAAYCRLVVGDIVAGTGFTIYANMIAGEALGQFTVRWVWN
jgi:hypothetical protein